MKKIILIVFLLIITNSVTYMVSNKVSVEEDFLEYHEKMMLIQANEEVELMSLFESVTGENYQNDTILYETLTQEIIPRYTLYKQIYNSMHNDHFETQEVKELLFDYGFVLQRRLGAFQLLQASIEKQNDKKLKNQAFENLEVANEFLEEFNELYNKLFRRYAFPG
ncbi:hypothetical protein VQL36_14315 [Chengkuizengella sp. SCS-71B]|uniref:hypothetical protein n=1 Tax=Chengkuizengella sp. SCS-71B TaxID=3115290 RepID=UPI0032C2106C